MKRITDDPAFFQKLVRITPGLVAVYNIKTGEFVYVNDSVKKLLGYSPAEFIKGGMPFVTSLMHPDDTGRIMKKNAAALRKENTRKNRSRSEDAIVSFEYRMRHKNGDYRWIKTFGSVFRRDRKGKVEYILNISTDITDRKQEEDYLRRMSRMLENDVNKRTFELSHIVDSITEGFIIYDNKMRYTYINKAASEFLGKPPGELVGKTPMDVYPGYHGSEVYKKNLEALKNRKAMIYEYYSPRFKRWFEVRYFPRKDGLSIFFSDVSIRKELEQKKDEFIGIASHELKTPLTSIKGYAQVLEKLITTWGNEKAMAYIDKQQKHIERLSNLITGLLDVSKIHAGRMQLDFSTFSFDDMVGDAVETVRPMAEHHKFMVKGRANRRYRGDYERLQQVVVNLLTNAMKYSPTADRVEIVVKATAKDIVVGIRDFGVGIAKKEQERLFERFYRSESTAKKFSGLGIGLYISREIIIRHSGKMWVESEKHKGSTFYFSLPLHARLRNA